MNRTFTLELDAGVLRRLEEYAAHFRRTAQEARRLKKPWQEIVPVG